MKCVLLGRESGHEYCNSVVAQLRRKKAIFSWKGKKKEGKKKESSFLHMDAHAEFAFRKFRRIARFQLGAADRAAALAQLRRLEGSHRQS